MTGISAPIFPVPRAHRAATVRKYRVRNPFRLLRRLIPKFKTVFVVVIFVAGGLVIGTSHAVAYVVGQESTANPIGIESINGGQGDGYWIQFEDGPMVHTLSYQESIAQCFDYQKLKAQASCKGTTRSTFWWVHMFKHSLNAGAQ